MMDEAERMLMNENQQMREKCCWVLLGNLHCGDMKLVAHLHNDGDVSAVDDGDVLGEDLFYWNSCPLQSC